VAVESPHEALRHALAAIPAPPRIWVALSGGRDSTVLLHAAATLEGIVPPGTLRAIHIDHGLQAQAVRWSEQCDALSARLGIPFETCRVDARARHGESPEAAARRARYAALGARLGSGDALLTAHHRDDQAETLLLQLLRGAGVAGLAAMPERARFATGWLLRPLLGLPRQALADYAAHHALAWCDDPSNEDTGLDRNYLRAVVLPALTARWPATAASLATSAGLCGEVSELLEECADADLAALTGDAADGTLPVAALAALSGPRRRNLLRRWLRRQGLTTPGRRHLKRIEVEAIGAAPDRVPCVAWPGGEVRRYRGRLIAARPRAAIETAAVQAWDPDVPLKLGHGTLLAVPVTGAGVACAALSAGVLTVRHRQGGERLRPAGRAHSHPLKKLLQEAGVPPWRRAALPLLYIGEQLAAVADLWVVADFAAAAGEKGLLLTWEEEPMDDVVD